VDCEGRPGGRSGSLMRPGTCEGRRRSLRPDRAGLREHGSSRQALPHGRFPAVPRSL